MSTKLVGGDSLVIPGYFRSGKYGFRVNCIFGFVHMSCCLVRALNTGLAHAAYSVAWVRNIDGRATPMRCLFRSDRVVQRIRSILHGSEAFRHCFALKLIEVTVDTCMRKEQ